PLPLPPTTSAPPATWFPPPPPRRPVETSTLRLTSTRNIVVTRTERRFGETVTETETEVRTVVSSVGFTVTATATATVERVVTRTVVVPGGRVEVRGSGIGEARVWAEGG